MLEVYSGVTNEKEKDRGTRGPVGLWSEGPRVMGALLCAKCLSVCLRFKPSGSPIVCVVQVVVDRSIYLFGESASPFIDEGDGLTRERGRVYVCQVLLPTPSGTG